MNKIKYTYKRQSIDVFADDYCMSAVDAKYFIDDAYAKRDRLRDLTKKVREHGCSNGIDGVVCIHMAHYKMAYEDYRKAQKLSVQAFKKCMADINKFKYSY